MVGTTRPVNKPGREIKTEIDDEVAFIAVTLAKLGYYGGNPAAVKEAPVDIVLQMLAYEGFIRDQKAAYGELNNEGR